MRSVTQFNDGWIFHGEFSPTMIAELQPGQAVRLPHNALDLEMNYFDERCYQKAFCYQRTLAWQPGFQNARSSSFSMARWPTPWSAAQRPAGRLPQGRLHAVRRAPGRPAQTRATTSSRCASTAARIRIFRRSAGRSITSPTPGSTAKSGSRSAKRSRSSESRSRPATKPPTPRASACSARWPIRAD